MLIFAPILKEIRTMSAALDILTAAVNAEKTAATAAIALLTELHQQLVALIAAGNSDAALASLTADLATQTQALNAAVTANAAVQPPA